MISGLYYQTIVRNVFSGETEFYIIPDSGYNIETKNGLLRCRGKIGIIVKNMPIELEGNYKNNEYIVSSSRIPTCSKESTFRLLNYIDDSITPHQKEVIANTVNNDLLGFMDEAEKRNILIKALSSKKTLLDLANGTASNETAAHFNKIVTIVDKIIITTEKLLNQEELVRQLMIYGVDIGKIEMLYRLTEILRQDGTIRENGIRINNGNCNLITDDSFIVKHFDSDKEAVTALLKDTKGISGEREILSPTKIFKKYGTNYLNRVLQPRGSEVLVAYGDTEYRLHDKIVMTKNNYDKNYINGDLGEIIGYKNGILQVQFHNKVVDIFREDMCNMSLAYAITIHKSQGSEFDEVYIILQDSVSSMLTRRLLYTSVTRARKKVVVYDVNDCINKAISNTNDNFRKTGWKNIKNIFAKNFHI